MKKKEFPGLPNPFQPTPLENELTKAIIEREEARVRFEQQRRQLAKATRRVQDIKLKINYRKEACHV